ncbi:hypothetical protein PISMIDRAFT_6659 [Pisolithus microcarpus 441]|uniref:Serine protease n=1 Tax=Pisolithus microcarpus 441 TaxID=765257 RepID=A0A0C9YXW7_9AGAM|nr:hypothetical protein BKA83DRAFT_6659 [Pisolithus microcarpus]KIK29955.1 hypothetical protein PISMIDRAFT_6659 [Pisolithus microcarpus 441]
MVYLRHHLTTALGMPIARESDDGEGSVGFFFHEGRDKFGNISNKVFGVSCAHVLREKTEGTYEFRGAGAPRHHVRVNGPHRFQRGLDEIEVAIGIHEMIANIHAKTIDRLKAKELSEDKEEAEEDARELRKAEERLDKQKRVVADLKKFYKDVKVQWSDIEHRNIGHVHYSPPIAVNEIKGEWFTEDWGTFALQEAKFKAQFKGNVVDLGTAITPEKLTTTMYPCYGSRTAFKYPKDRLLRINGVVQQELLKESVAYDGDGKPCYVVLKDGSATDLTVGRYGGMESFIGDDGVESIEIGIYSYSKTSGPFVAKGDSGSLIFDGSGRMVGLLHSARSGYFSSAAMVTYATPAWWLIRRIMEKYPHANFNGTAW